MRRLLAFTTLIILLTAALIGTAIAYGHLHRGAGVISFQGMTPDFLYVKTYLYDLDWQMRVNFTHAVDPVLVYGAAWSSDGSGVVFNRIHFDPGATYLIDFAAADRTTRVLLPGGIQTDPYASAWSPDGHWLAGTTYPGDGAHDLTLLDMSTDPPAVDRTRLEDYYPMSFLVWSPDSTRLIVSGLGAETAIYEVQTGALTPLIALQGSDRIAGSGASWSPDGQQIAFAGMNNNGNYYYLYVVNVDGTELHQVIDSPVANYPPFWMPDGQQVMVNTYPPPEIRDLALVNVNTGTITPVIHDSSALYRPVALLDLSHLLASGYSNDPDATEQVYVIDLTTGDSTWIQTGVADVFYLQRVPW